MPKPALTRCCKPGIYLGSMGIRIFNRHWKRKELVTGVLFYDPERVFVWIFFYITAKMGDSII
jgi:hypothetical protein